MTATERIFRRVAGIESEVYAVRHDLDVKGSGF